MALTASSSGITSTTSPTTSNEGLGTLLKYLLIIIVLILDTSMTLILLSASNTG